LSIYLNKKIIHFKTKSLRNILFVVQKLHLNEINLDVNEFINIVLINNLTLHINIFYNSVEYMCVIFVNQKLINHLALKLLL